MAPVDDICAAFVHCMAALGPFEASPHIAIAVSGGADSMALILLADQWARQQGGRVTALTVDHGLRPESGEEARQVGRWLDRRGIDHRVLTWRGEKPATGIQASARQARYKLMAAHCRNAGILHLLIGHHQQDQAETFLMRLGRSSGIDGLAAMSPVREVHGLRLLRPLLQTPKQRLRDFLVAQDQDWIEDPSNQNTAFARIRIRNSLPGLANAGVSLRSLTGTAAHMARVRIALEATASTLLGRCATVDPCGYAGLAGRELFAAPAEISLRALSRVIMCIGGAVYPSASEKLENLHEKMKAHVFDQSGWRGATLGRCRIVPGPAGSLRILRELRNLPDPCSFSAGQDLSWDGRFQVTLKSPVNREFRNNHKGLTLAPLNRSGLIEIGPESAAGVPEQVLWTLPALFDDRGVTQVPHLNYLRPGLQGDQTVLAQVAFLPRQSLSGSGFAIAE